MAAIPFEKLRVLDGLRALAIVQVILFHHRLEGESQAFRPWFQTILAPTRFGFSGVHLFLVLSGFCLALSLLRRGDSTTLLSYLKGRWWRIAPTYYAAMAVYLTVIVVCRFAGIAHRADGHLSFRQVWRHLLFIHGLSADTIQTINPPFWSLSLEFQFYLTLPLLFAIAVKFGARAVVAIVVVATIVYRLSLDRFFPSIEFAGDGFFLGRWAEFGLGLGVAFWYRSPRIRPSGRWAVLVFLAFFPFALTLAARGFPLASNLGFGIAYAALLVAVIESAETGGRLGLIFGSDPLVKIGVISYSLYLMHSLVLDWEYRIYKSLVPNPSSATEAALLVVSLAAILGLGWTFHHLVERRFLGRSGSQPPRPTGTRSTIRRPDRVSVGLVS